MTNPKQQLTEALASGNPRRTADAVERYVADVVWRATGKQVPQPVVQTSRTLMTYGG